LSKPSKNTNMKPFLLFFIFFAILLFSAFSCKEKPSSIQIDFTKTEISPSDILEPQQNKTIRFAMLAGNSPLPTMNFYGQLFEHIGKKLGYPVEFVQRKTYSEINELLRTGEIDFAIISSGSYVQDKEEFGLESVAVPQVYGRSYGYSYVIARVDSNIYKFNDLRGRTYAFTNPSSTYGRLFPVYKLALMQETPNSFFSHYIFTYGHSKSIKAVEEGLVDGASVYSLIYDNLAISAPERVWNINIIDRSPPFGLNPIVTSPHSSALLKNQFSKILLSLHMEQDGQRILKELNFERFVLPDESSYQPIRKMRDFVMKKTERLKSR